MDEKFVEQASELALAEISAGIDRVRQASHQKRPLDFDGSCRCGEGIPQARIDHGFFNCVSCQTVTEQTRKHYRNPK